MHLLLLEVLFPFHVYWILVLLILLMANGICVSLNGVFYFNAIAVNGVFEIDMNDCMSNNNNSMYIISKRIKYDLNSS